MAVTYTAPEYDEKKYRQGIDTSYYDNAKTEFNDQTEQSRATQLGEAQKTQQSALKQAYINRIQDQQKLNRNLAMSGIRGGATETSNLKLANQYGQARANANANYTNSVNTINQNIDQSKFENMQNVNSQAEQYRQNLAQAKWQADREDSANETQRQTEYWSNYYTNFYSGYSKKDANKAVKNLSAQLDKTTDPMTSIQLQQAISGAKARLGVLANK